ncbi:MAG: MFS transporter [Planctomycetes bacterium]|nr:MFS transporter [Planctomycetota bacterium]
MADTTSTWRFPRAFWVANGSELCERAAYYGTFIALRTYLIRVVGLDDVQAGLVAGVFGALVYLLSFFTGAITDRVGFRKALMLAFGLLTVGYGALALVSTLAPVLGSLFLIVVGGAFIKPAITGTATQCSDDTNRARAFSIFYMVVNIGSFTGKTIVAPIRIELGVANVPYFSAAASFVALVLIALFFRPQEQAVARPRSLQETLAGMATVVRNVRFTALILITAGFWAVQGQLYGSMPDYVLRMAGEAYKPEWYANVNPLIVVLCVVGVTQLVAKWKPENSITIAMILIPCSALLMSASSLFSGPVDLLGIAVHPITLMLVIGIAVQGFAECFISPKYLEFASKQAPAGREALYLGYAHLNTFFAWLIGLPFGGYLLQEYCPDPSTLSETEHAAHTAWLAGRGAMPAAYEHAHWIWYAFAGVGAVALVAMIVFVVVTRRLDARRLDTRRA